VSVNDTTNTLMITHRWASFDHFQIFSSLCWERQVWDSCFCPEKQQRHL